MFLSDGSGQQLRRIGKLWFSRFTHKEESRKAISFAAKTKVFSGPLKDSETEILVFMRLQDNYNRKPRLRLQFHFIIIYFSAK